MIHSISDVIIRKMEIAKTKSKIKKFLKKQKLRFDFNKYISKSNNTIMNRDNILSLLHMGVTDTYNIFSDNISIQITSKTISLKDITTGDITTYSILTDDDNVVYITVFLSNYNCRYNVSYCADIDYNYSHNSLRYINTASHNLKYIFKNLVGEYINL